MFFYWYCRSVVSNNVHAMFVIEADAKEWASKENAKPSQGGVYVVEKFDTPVKV